MALIQGLILGPLFFGIHFLYVKKYLNKAVLSNLLHSNRKLIEGPVDCRCYWSRRIVEKLQSIQRIKSLQFTRWRWYSYLGVNIKERCWGKFLGKNLEDRGLEEPWYQEENVVSDVGSSPMPACAVLDPACSLVLVNPHSLPMAAFCFPVLPKIFRLT